MIHTARAHQLKVMIGCMIESSIAITAAAHLTPLADYVDLDGALLLAHDPYDGATFPGGRIVLPERPGLGIRPRGAEASVQRDRARRASNGVRSTSRGHGASPERLPIDEEV
jgi:L-alanine-DL-glutamate epimerase-like enolase superfamily enzyme